jgi:hypothetical protein
VRVLGSLRDEELGEGWLLLPIKIAPLPDKQITPPDDEEGRLDLASLSEGTEDCLEDCAAA